MAKGIQKAVIKYVLADDVDELPEDRTIFHIRQLSFEETIPSTKRIQKALTQKPDGSFDTNEKIYLKAKKLDFIESLVKVENYAFGHRFSELQKKGVIDFDDQSTIHLLFEDLTPDWVNEIIEVARGNLKGIEIKDELSKDDALEDA